MKRLYTGFAEAHWKEYGEGRKPRDLAKAGEEMALDHFEEFLKFAEDDGGK